MPYIAVSDFKLGVDRSRPIHSGANGSVYSAINCHFSRGGDVEKRKSFVDTYTLPAATFGLKATATALYTFGSDGTITVPSGMSYQQLVHPVTPATAMTALLWTELYGGKIYAIARYADDAIYHFYDGTNIADWNGGAGNPTEKGVIARTLQRKVYSAGSFQLSFSGVDTAIGFTTPTDTGAGQINMSNHLAGSEALTALAVYQSKLAVFSRNVVQIWLMFSDPASNVQDQVLENIGTRSPGTVLSYHEHDVVFLDDSGIRSLRARSDLNIAGIDDIGTNVDDLIQMWKDEGTITDANIEAAVAVIEPRDKRLWIVIGPKVLVFTYFPARKITAWSWYEPGFTISALTVLTGKVYARAGNTVYLYGGAAGTTYDSSRVTVQMPFLSAGKDGHYKQFQGFDIAATGTWDVSLLVDPNDLNVKEHCGDLEDFTFGKEGAAHVGHHTHVAPLLVNEEAGYASLSKVAIYFQGADSAGSTE